MIQRFERAQFIAFVVVSILVVILAAFYTGIPASLGVGRYPVRVELPQAATLYPRAMVTLAGSSIGEVKDISLTGRGVVATISVDSGTRIPSGSTVSIRSVSAIGEQYLDFTPGNSSSPDVEPDTDFSPTAVSMPTDINRVLERVNRLIATIPRDDLNSAIDEFSVAFSGSSRNLQRILDSSSLLLGTATANLAPTKRLIDDLRPVLETQKDVGPDTLGVMRNLAEFTAQLKDSDRTLRGTIEKTPAFTDGVDQLVERLREPLPRLLADLGNVSQVAEVYLPNVRNTLTVVPAMINAVQSSIFNTPIPDALRINFKAVVNDPPPCTRGFAGANQRNPTDLSPAPPETTVFCDVPHSSPQAVRGSHNAACPNDPNLRSPDAAGCGLRFQSKEEEAQALRNGLDTIMDTARNSSIASERPAGAPPPDTTGSVERQRSAQASSYDPRSGVFVTPDGQPFILGRGQSGGPGPQATDPDWRSLFRDPLSKPSR
jgi:phospholipid/cholesterol/gamma-HCH transport system substrate-binding protein